MLLLLLQLQLRLPDATRTPGQGRIGGADHRGAVAREKLRSCSLSSLSLSCICTGSIFASGLQGFLTFTPMFADAVGLRASLPPPAPCHPPAPSSTLTPSCDSSSSSLRAPSVTFTLKVVTLQNSLESAEHLAQLAYRAGVHYIVSGKSLSASHLL